MSEIEKPQSGKKPAKPSKNRRKSRELVLKGIYRLFLNQGDLRQISRESVDDPDYERADEAYFQQLLKGVIEQLPSLDDQLAEFIDRPVAELSPIEHAILCISSYELINDLSIPFRVVINEGVELAKSYGGTDGHKYVNGVLDKLAAKVRAIEISRK